MSTPGDERAVRMTTAGTRWLLWTASALVLGVGVLLFFFPTNTDVLFSWTINPPITASFLGGAYLASFFLEFLSAREQIWVRARPAVPAVFVFTALTLGVTVLHIDKFHFGTEFSLVTQAITWIWLLVYIVVPVAMAILIALQMRSAGDDPPRQAPLPARLKHSLAWVGVLLVVLGIALLIAPTSVAPKVWPWPLSALTGRAIGAWLVGTGLSTFHSAWENDLVRVRPAMISYMMLGALQMIALAIFAGSTHPVTGEDVFDWTSARAWIYAASVIAFGVMGFVGWKASRDVRLDDRSTSLS